MVTLYMGAYMLYWFQFILLTVSWLVLDTN